MERMKEINMDDKEQTKNDAPSGQPKEPEVYPPNVEEALDDLLKKNPGLTREEAVKGFEALGYI